ncbi:hypothetical protein AXF42_Ash017885 [Apostasia shenzhenica]|uniref:Uncharacterized protein n=1 Tax=Apostasia shenzhenica TaxID=1088818 RepID=A0A2I0AY80_9ASPA|nr:hypothetical protein AXF42_Ash017885 [Apostasia shenzhenica]
MAAVMETLSPLLPAFGPVSCSAEAAPRADASMLLSADIFSKSFCLPNEQMMLKSKNELEPLDADGDEEDGDEDGDGDEGDVGDFGDGEEELSEENGEGNGNSKDNSNRKKDPGETCAIYPMILNARGFRLSDNWEKENVCFLV